MSISLKDRVLGYQSITDYKLLAKLPVIITINGRSFGKLTSLLEKPFDTKLAECLCAALVMVSQEIDGAFFGYAHNDKMVIVARNDLNNDTMPFCKGDIQRIASVVASVATLRFVEYAATQNLNLMGDPIFYASVFAAPNIIEAINALIFEQQQAIQSSIYFACVYELLKKDFDRNDIQHLLTDTTFDDKIALLKQECQVDFNEYPALFRRGAAVYRAPKLIEYEGREIIKQKWIVNDALPLFTADRGFLAPIFKSGGDIVRQGE
jgi:tRNA(His) guanylyltransferase